MPIKTCEALIIFLDMTYIVDGHVKCLKIILFGYGLDQRRFTN